MIETDKETEEALFECPKLNKGDTISLDFEDSTNNQRILSPVKVSYVLVSLSMNPIPNSDSLVIEDAEQHLFIEPVTIEPPDEDTNRI